MPDRRMLLKFTFGQSKIVTQPDNLYNEERFRQGRRDKSHHQAFPSHFHHILEHGPIAVDQDWGLLGIWPADLRDFPATLYHC